MSTLSLVIKEFRDILSFLLHCSVTEGASLVSALVPMCAVRVGRLKDKDRTTEAENEREDKERERN